MIADQNKALELDPNLAVAFQRRAAAIIAKADTKSDPQKDLDQALALNPNFTEALCDRALLYSMKGELPRAKADLDQALKIDPNCAKAHLQRGRAYLSQKNYDEAIAWFRESLGFALIADVGPDVVLAGFTIRSSSYAAALVPAWQIVAGPGAESSAAHARPAAATDAAVVTFLMLTAAYVVVTPAIAGFYALTVSYTWQWAPRVVDGVVTLAFLVAVGRLFWPRPTDGPAGGGGGGVDGGDGGNRNPPGPYTSGAP